MQEAIFYSQTTDLHYAVSFQIIETDECGCNQIDSLRFEVKCTHLVLRFIFMLLKD